MAEALVEYDYDAEQDDELTLHVGDIIKNVVTADGGWWEGELKGRKGMFPDNFVKLRVKDSSSKKEEKREATQRKSVKELANKFKDGMPLSGAQGSVTQKKKDAPKVKKCKVMFDYKPENEDELELAVGQTIDFIKEVEEGWWEGSLNGKTGVFPSNFVEMMENGEGENADGSRPQSGGAGEADADFQQIKGKKVVGVGLGNIFQGGPIKLRNTKKGDPAKPTKTDDRDSRDSRHATANPAEGSKREKQGAVERAIVRYSYAAEQPDELNLKEGEVIRVLDKHLEDDGWWRGEVHGKIGVFPDNFVELLPSQEEPSKAPKKPPPPAGKNIYPKLPDKAHSVEEKNASVKKEQEAVADRPPPNAGLKKTAAPPPIGRKPGVIPKAGEAVGKPEPPRPSEPARVELRGKEHGTNHHAPPLSNKTEDGEEASFDAVEASSHKLVHLTASRAKGPKKRPPSTVNLPANKKNRLRGLKEGDKLPEVEETTKGQNHVHVQPEKPPLPANKEHKHISPSEPERSSHHRHHSAHDNHSNSSREGHELRHAHAAAPPPRPPEPTRHLNASPGPDTSALSRLVEELQREVRELRSHTVSKNEYNDLRTEYLRLKQDFDMFRASHSKKLRDLMMEVDEEKKLRLNTQVEMERVRKLLAESHV